MNKFEIKDIFAGTVALGCLVLIGLGLDGEVKALLGVVVGYYFGTKIKKA